MKTSALCEAVTFTRLIKREFVQADHEGHEVRLSTNTGRSAGGTLIAFYASSMHSCTSSSSFATHSSHAVSDLIIDANFALCILYGSCCCCLCLELYTYAHGKAGRCSNHFQDHKCVTRHN